MILVSLIGFWEWRSALLMALSIPLTLLMTFGMMSLLGMDIQQISIASLIIALGLLVDDPVVAGDAIKRELADGQAARHRGMAWADEAGHGDSLRHGHEHRRVPSVSDARRKHRAVHLLAAGGDDLLAGCLANRVVDVHPAAWLLSAARRGRAFDRRAESRAASARRIIGSAHGRSTIVGS